MNDTTKPRLIAAALLTTCGGPALAAPAVEPNIIFILADDLGWSDTTLYGTTKFYETPNLERLAKRGMVFTRAYAASPQKVPDNTPPAVTVTAGDWKLIRLFHNGKSGEHTYQLYHLSDDAGEKTNLAGQQPDRVKELDARIEKFLTDTKAVVPKPNPAYQPNAAANPAKGSPNPAESKSAPEPNKP